MTIHTHTYTAPIPTQYSIPLSVKLINHAGPHTDNALNLFRDSKQVKIVAFDFSCPTWVFMFVFYLCRTFTSANQKRSSYGVIFSLKYKLTMITFKTGETVAEWRPSIPSAETECWSPQTGIWSRGVNSCNTMFIGTQRGLLSTGKGKGKCKGKAFPNKSWRLRRGMEYLTSILTLTLATSMAADLSALQAGFNLLPRKFLGSNYC